MQHIDRAAAEHAFDGGQQVARIGGFQLAVDNQVGEQDAIRLEYLAGAEPELAGDQMGGNRGVRTVDIDHHGIEAPFGGGDETAGVVGDELATRCLLQEMLFGDIADFRVDIDIGVAIQRLAVRQGEAAGAEDQDVAVAIAQVVEQHLAQVADVARVVGRLAVVDERGERLVDHEGAAVRLAFTRDRRDQVIGVGRVGGDRMVVVEAGGQGHAAQCQPASRPLSAPGEEQGTQAEDGRAGEDGGGNAQPLHDDQRQRQRAEEGAEGRPVERHAAGFTRALGLHQVGQDGHRLAEQPGQRAEHATDEEQVGDQCRLQVGEQPVHRDAGQADAGQCGGNQEIAGDDPGVVGGHLGARGVAKGQGEQEEADGRCRDDDGAADMRHQTAQGDDLGPERAEAFDEDDGVEKGARHPRIIVQREENPPRFSFPSREDAIRMPGGGCRAAPVGLR